MTTEYDRHRGPATESPTFDDLRAALRLLDDKIATVTEAIGDRLASAEAVAALRTLDREIVQTVLATVDRPQYPTRCPGPDAAGYDPYGCCDTTGLFDDDYDEDQEDPYDE